MSRHKRETKRAYVNGFPKIHRAVARHQHNATRLLVKPNLTLAQFLASNAGAFKESRSASIYKMEEGTLEHKFTLERRMRRRRKWKTQYRGDPITSPGHPAMMAMNSEEVIFYDYEKGVRWAFNLDAGDFIPTDRKFKKSPGGGSEIFVPVYAEPNGGNQRNMTGMMVIAGPDLGLVDSTSRGKMSVIETAMLSANIMSIVSHIFEHRLDGITGLPGMKDFKRDIAIAVEKYVAGGSDFGLLMFDLDHFKQVNDDNGHLAGDRVLAEFAKAASRSVREEQTARNVCPDAFYRIGGEEFVATLQKINLENALLVADRIRKKVREMAISTAEGLISITCSIGVVCISDVVNRGARLETEEIVDSLRGIVDEALYHSKMGGRDTVHYAESDGKGGYGFREYEQ